MTAGKEMVDKTIKRLSDEYSRSKETEEELKEFRRGTLPDISRRLLDYLSLDRPRKLDAGPFCLFDPIYGGIYLEPELLPLFFHPIIQRLNFVRQLSFSFFEYPQATHTRLSHSLGTAHAIEMALIRIFTHGKLLSGKSLVGIPESETKRMRSLVFLGKVCGLLHDCGHGPFGHALDRWMGLRLNLGAIGVTYQAKPDKYFTVKYVKEYLSDTLSVVGRNYDFDSSNITSVFERKVAQPFEHLIYQLVDSALDLDRADFLTRDPYFTGLPARVLNLITLVDLMVPVQDGNRYIVAFRREALENILHFLEMRDYMYDNCYDRPKKVAAEAMLTMALEAFTRNNRELNLQKLQLMTDEQLLDLITSWSARNSIELELVKDLRQGRVYDNVFEYRVPADPTKASAEVQSFLRGILNPKTRAMMYIDKMIQWGRQICQDNEEVASRVVVVPFSIESQGERVLETKILVDTGVGYETQSVDSLVPGIKEKIVQRLNQKRRFLVFASQRLSSDETAAVRKECESFFGSSS